MSDREKMIFVPYFFYCVRNAISSFRMMCAVEYTLQLSKRERDLWIIGVITCNIP